MFNLNVLLFSIFTLGYSACPDGTTSVPGEIESNWPCLFLSKDRLSFTEAVSKCKSKKGHLVSIPNKYVNKMVSGKNINVFLYRLYDFRTHTTFL